ncbi:hypothetical protein BDQ17DRAFT_1428605 [Cyathus striatus]|nr:hypothetical protein BDQ17DRAFT_1428605 [Cyathus striatus]
MKSYSVGPLHSLSDSDINTSTEIISIHGLPFYYSVAYALMLSCIIAESIASIFDPSQDFMFPTPKSVLDAAVAAQSNRMFTFPYFLEEWSKNPQHVEALKKFKSIVFGGGPMSFEVGETLFHEGVPLSSSFGITETGPLTVFFRSDLQSAEWNWLKSHPGLDLVFTPIGDGLYKLVVKASHEFFENELKKLPTSNTMIGEVPAYDTADIVTCHPTDPTLWRVIARQDTLIFHSSGEKTNPIPIEECLQQNKRIATAIMFGREQLLAGVIVLPEERYLFDTENPIKVKEYLNMIWDSVQEANARAPTHSCIFKEMIIIASPNRPFEYTDKGYPKCHSILREYDDEIHKLYSKANSEVSTDDFSVSISDCSDLDMIKYFICVIVSSTLSQTIEDDDDIFSSGADNLCAMLIRNTIICTLSGNQPPSKTEKTHLFLSPDLLLAYPTINSLSSYIFNLPLWLRFKELSSAWDKKDITPEMEPKLPVWNKLLDNMRAPSGMVKFKDGIGEIPLILIPDITGSSGIFKLQCQEMYKSAVWSVDIMQEPPTKFDSVHHLTSFYLKQVKRECPVGPYHFASISGSSVVLLYLVKLLEQSGDKILQVAFLDHFPSVYLHGVSNPSVFNPNISAMDLNNYVNDNLRCIQRMVSAARKPELEATLAWVSDELDAIINNQPIHPLMENTMKRMKNTILICIKFLFGDEFRLEGNPPSISLPYPSSSFLKPQASRQGRIKNGDWVLPSSFLARHYPMVEERVIG